VHSIQILLAKHLDLQLKMTKEHVLQAIEFLCQRARDPKIRKGYNMKQIQDVYIKMNNLVGEDQ
jgi:hypothetical protein